MAADQAGLAMLATGATLPEAGGARKRPLEVSISSERRTKLRHYDLLPAQTLNPMGSSGLEVVTDEALFKMICAGNKQAAVFSEIGLNEPERRAVAISRFAQVYSEAIQRFKDNQYSKSLLKETVYEQVIEQADAMLELLSKFNQAELAQRQLSGMRSVAYARAPTALRHDTVAMQTACTELHSWLSKDSLLRSFVSFLAGAGCYWSAYAHERAIRSFVSAGNGTRDDILHAMSSRATSDASTATGTMAALERIRC